MNWLRLYHEFLDDPKILNLPGRTQLFLVKIWCVSSKQSVRGTLPDLKTIQLMTRASEAKTFLLVDELKRAGFIDENVITKELTVHGWNSRQYESDDVSTRVKRSRERSKKQVCNVTPNVTRNVTVTPPETDTETDTEFLSFEEREMETSDHKTEPRSGEDAQHFFEAIEILGGKLESEALSMELGRLDRSADREVRAIEGWRWLAASRVIAFKGVKSYTAGYAKGIARGVTLRDFMDWDRGLKGLSPIRDRSSPALTPKQEERNRTKEWAAELVARTGHFFEDDTDVRPATETPTRAIS